MATKEQYAAKYAVIASSMRKWQKIVDELGPKKKGWRHGIARGPSSGGLTSEESQKLYDAEKGLAKATKDAQEFRNNLNFNVAGGGVIWDYIFKTQTAINNPPGAPPGPTGAGLPPTDAAGQVSRGMPSSQPQAPRTPFATPEGMFGSEEDIESNYLPDRRGYIDQNIRPVPKPITGPSGVEIPGTTGTSSVTTKDSVTGEVTGEVTDVTTGETTAASGATDRPDNKEFAAIMMKIEAAYKEIDNLGTFREVPPNINDPKYMRPPDANGFSLFDDAYYQRELASYNQKLATWNRNYNLIQNRIDNTLSKLIC